jgi:hypothetical protein
VNSAQILSIIALALGGGGSFVAYRTAGSQARKQRNEGGEVYVRASDGAVTTMQRVVDELEEDLGRWKKRARDAEEENDHLRALLRATRGE